MKVVVDTIVVESLDKAWTERAEVSAEALQAMGYVYAFPATPAQRMEILGAAMLEIIGKVAGKPDEVASVISAHLRIERAAAHVLAEMLP